VALPLKDFCSAVNESFFVVSAGRDEVEGDLEHQRQAADDHRTLKRDRQLDLQPALDIHCLLFSPRAMKNSASWR
jgi:hypothetical protein